MPPSTLATCVIPWDSRFRFQERAFRDHVRLIARRMTRHIYIFGTAGEGHAVSDALFREVAEVFIDEGRKQAITPMLGVISNSQATVVERIEYGLGLGYREFQISFPAWGRLSDDEVDTFFSETCGRFPQAQFLHYNTPRGGRVLTGSEYRRLGERYPSLAAVKFSSGDNYAVRELVLSAAPIQCFLTEPAFVLARDLVECGLLVSLSGVRASLPRRFMEARGEELRRLGRLAFEINDLLRASLGTAGRDVHMDGAFEKVIARAHGASVPLRLLPPYQGFSEPAYRRFVAGLRAIEGLDDD